MDVKSPTKWLRRPAAVISPTRNQRRDASATFRKFTYEEIVARDKANLDIFWLKDESQDRIGSVNLMLVTSVEHAVPPEPSAA